MLTSKEIYALKTKLDILEADAVTYRDRHYSVHAFGGSWDSPAHRDHYRALKLQIHDIKETIIKG